MKVDVLMPQLGESITEGTIVKWWKQPGDHVKKDETLLEISTDKVDSEIPSPYEGTLVELKANENDTVNVDATIAIIETEGNGAVVAVAEAAPAAEVAEPAALAAETVPAVGGGLIDVLMPQLGESITEGTIVKWWKQVGDSVEKDETLLEISTDKVDSEIPSPYAGTVAELLAGENDTIDVGSVIAKITSSDAVGEPAAAPAPVPAASSPEPAAAPQPAAPAVAETQAPASRDKNGRFYSPLVRAIARKENISMPELEAIPGSGLNGRVTKQDILSYLESGRVVPAAQPAQPSPAAPAQTVVSTPAPPPPPSAPQVQWSPGREEVVPMDNIRKIIADHMVKSKHTSPHVYGVAEVDFTNVMNIVKKNRARFKDEQGLKLTVNPCILFAVSKAIQDFPRVNSSVDGYNIIEKRYLNIGMAVATPKGLIVPVLKSADEMNFLGIARRAYDLAIRARDSKLKPDDIQGATITVTNYGVFGNVIGFPIINQPNVAILGVAAIKKRPVVLETDAGDVIGIRSIGYMTLSYDHRIVDGELGDQFLQRVRYYLENFDEGWL